MNGTELLHWGSKGDCRVWHGPWQGGEGGLALRADETAAWHGRVILPVYRFLAAVFVGLLIVNVAGGKEGLPLMPDFRFLGPLPAVSEAAQKEGIPLGGFDAPIARSTLNLGDNITALVTLIDGSEISQWIVQFVVSELTEQEKRSQRPFVGTVTIDAEIFRFSNHTSTALAVRTIGPFVANKKSRVGSSQVMPEKRARVIVTSGFLGMGLAPAAALFTRLDAEKIAGRTEQPKLTAEDKKAYAGMFGAMMEFYGIASKTPGLDDLVKSVVDVPWLSVILKRRINAGIEVKSARLIEAKPWALPQAEHVYAMPTVLSINSNPALAFQLAVVDPVTPLRTCAGIIGIAAQRPDGKGPHLMIQLVAARCGAGGSAETPMASPPVTSKSY